MDHADQHRSAITSSGSGRPRGSLPQLRFSSVSALNVGNVLASAGDDDGVGAEEGSVQILNLDPSAPAWPPSRAASDASAASAAAAAVAAFQYHQRGSACGINHVPTETAGRSAIPHPPPLASIMKDSGAAGASQRSVSGPATPRSSGDAGRHVRISEAHTQQPMHQSAPTSPLAATTLTISASTNGAHPLSSSVGGGGIGGMGGSSGSGFGGGAREGVADPPNVRGAFAATPPPSPQYAAISASTTPGTSALAAPNRHPASGAGRGAALVASVAASSMASGSASIASVQSLLDISDPADKRLIQDYIVRRINRTLSSVLPTAPASAPMADFA